MSARADQFAAALNELDESGDVQPISQIFADATELHRPELPGDGEGGAESFWTTYRRQFDHLATRFTRVDEAGDLAVLEWTSDGQLATGRPIQYAGISVLTFDDTDRIVRFVTYYDTAAFTSPSSAQTN